MLLLDVPYSEKDQAKALGAWWNPDLKKWYVKDKRLYHKFLKWCPNYDDSSTFLVDYVYVIEANRRCWRCKKTTRLAILGSDHIYNVVRKRFEKYFALFLPSTVERNLELVKYFKNYNIHITYSNFVKASYLANCCEHCNALHGDWFLAMEQDSPFVMTSIEKASNLVVYKHDLEYDQPVPVISYTSSNFLIKEHARFIDCAKSFH